jgi:transglutaminase-like putative cysteine protease
MRALAVPLVAVCLAVAAGPAGAAPQVRIAPPPAWVTPQPVDLAAVPSATASGGVDYLLVDDQVRVGPPSSEHYRHVARRILSPKGVENGSEERVDFDPVYEQLVLHEVTIHRDGTRISAVRAADVKIIQRETELDRRLYDGTLTAVVFLRDVRQGDVIETSWTIRGTNPVFGARWATTAALGYRVRVGRVAFRLLAPEGAPISHRVHGLDLAPEVSRGPAHAEYRWVRSPAPAVEYESDLPEGFHPVPWLELSTWEDWDAVVRWALPLYGAGAPSAAMRAKVDGWRGLPDEAARAAAALAFVQDEVRYLGIQLGASSHRPHRPAEVFARRFGDCKDKSVLLVALLHALGIEAAPALVNTEEGGVLDGRLPSPVAFDHVIVRARVGGVDRWLDPTRSLERAPIAARVPPPYGRALVIARGERGLVALPEAVASTVRVASTWRVSDLRKPVRLEVVTTFEGARAVGMRHTLAQDGVSELQRRYLEHYAKRDPGIALASPLEVEDAPDADRVTTRERYDLPARGANEELELVADVVLAALTVPETALRKQPLRIEHPVAVEERVRVELPWAPTIAREEMEVKGRAAQLTRKGWPEGNAYVMEYRYRTLAPSIAAEAVPGHLAKLREMREETVRALPIAASRVPGAPFDGAKLAVMGAALAAVLAVGYVLYSTSSAGLRAWWSALVRWRRRHAWHAKLHEDPGDAPHVATPGRYATELASRTPLARCRTVPQTAPDDREDPQVTAGSIFSLAFEVWWRNVFRFAVPSILGFLPLAFVIFLGPGVIGWWFEGTFTRLLFPLTLFQAGAVTQGALDHLSQRPVRVGAMIAAGAWRALPAWAIVAFAALAPGPGAPLLSVPALVATVVLGMALPSILAEGIGPMNAIRRTWRLTKGYRPSVVLSAVGIVLAVLLAGAASNRAIDFLRVELPAGIIVVEGLRLLAWGLPLVFPATCYHAVRIAAEGNVDDTRRGAVVSPDIG